jgi:ribosome biogenesis GTPase A
MEIQWYPGHMAKTRRLISENLKAVDLVAELLDARIPLSGMNTDFEELLLNKPRLFLLNKSDLADPNATRQWLDYFAGRNMACICVNSESGEGIAKVVPKIREILKEQIERQKQKGIEKNIRVMAVGIPNVGKSSFINRLSRRAAAKVGDRPGVTVGKQWIKITSDLELLDTPGILVPKFKNQTIAKHLAYTGAIRDEILDQEEIAFSLLDFLRDRYPDSICGRYRLEREQIEGQKGYEILELICKKRGMIVSGGEADYERGAAVVLNEMRGGKLGKITFELPGDEFLDDIS